MKPKPSKRAGSKSGQQPATSAGAHWVFHRAALGDSVLLWPMLRQWRMRGLDVVLVCDGDKGRLAARELGIRAEDAEAPRLNGLWTEGAKVQSEQGVAAVVAYLGREGEATQRWMANARRMFPGAAIRHRSARPSRTQALRYPLPVRRGNRTGPVVMHVGAGAEEKRWAMARWAELAQSGPRVRLIAGEVEHERMTPAERRVFEAAGGEFVSSLADLAEIIRAARVFVCGDSGPAHLAAQMGAPVVSLFGPGDPIKWAPVGPEVEVVAPPRPRGMDWLEVARVREAIEIVERRVYGK